MRLFWSSKKSVEAAGNKSTNVTTEQLAQKSNEALKEGNVVSVGTMKWADAIIRAVTEKQDLIIHAVKKAYEKYNKDPNTRLRKTMGQSSSQLFVDLLDVLADPNTNSELAAVSLQTFLMKGNKASDVLLTQLILAIEPSTNSHLTSDVLSQMKQDIIKKLSSFFAGVTPVSLSMAEVQTSHQVGNSPNVTIKIFINSDAAKAAFDEHAWSSSDGLLSSTVFFYVDEETKLYCYSGQGYGSVPWMLPELAVFFAEKRQQAAFIGDIAEHINTHWAFYGKFIRRIHLFPSAEEGCESANEFPNTINVALSYDADAAKWNLHYCHAQGRRLVPVPMKSELAVLLGQRFVMWPRIVGQAFSLEHMPAFLEKGRVAVGVHGNILYYAGYDGEQKVSGEIALADVADTLRLDTLKNLKVLQPYCLAILRRINEKTPRLITEDDLLMQEWVDNSQAQSQSISFPERYSGLEHILSNAITPLIERFFSETKILIVTQKDKRVADLRLSFWLDPSSGVLRWCGAREKQEVDLKQYPLLEEYIDSLVRQYTQGKAILGTGLPATDYFRQLLLMVNIEGTKISDNLKGNLSKLYQSQREKPVVGKLEKTDQRFAAIAELLATRVNKKVVVEEPVQEPAQETMVIESRPF